MWCIQSFFILDTSRYLWPLLSVANSNFSTVRSFLVNDKQLAAVLQVLLAVRSQQKTCCLVSYTRRSSWRLTNKVQQYRRNICAHSVVRMYHYDATFIDKLQTTLHINSNINNNFGSLMIDSAECMYGHFLPYPSVPVTYAIYQPILFVPFLVSFFSRCSSSKYLVSTLCSSLLLSIMSTDSSSSRLVLSVSSVLRMMRTPSAGCFLSAQLTTYKLSLRSCKCLPFILQQTSAEVSRYFKASWSERMVKRLDCKCGAVAALAILQTGSFCAWQPASALYW